MLIPIVKYLKKHSIIDVLQGPKYTFENCDSLLPSLQKKWSFDENSFIDVEQIRKQLQKQLHEKAIF